VNYQGGETVQTDYGSYGGANTLALIGIGLGALGGFAQGQSIAQGYAGTAESAEFASKQVRAQGKYKALRSTIAMRRTVGAQVSTFGALGIVGNTGSALDDISETVKEMTLSKMMDAWNTEQTARGYEIEAEDYRKAAKKSRQSGLLGLAGTAAGAAIGYVVGGGLLGAAIGAGVGGGVGNAVGSLS
jgi:hypothetical protein